MLNTGTVLLGASVGLLLGSRLPPDLQTIALSGIGLVTVAIALKMAFATKNVLIVAAAVALGGVIGKAMGIDVGLAQVAEWARGMTGGADARFNDGLVTASVLFCVGPMTVLGCVQDGVERKIDLLTLKSLLDGIASVFLAAASPAFGAGVLCSAAVVLVVQGAMTACARPLEPLTRRGHIMDELTAAGGAMTLAIGLSLLEVAPVKDLPKEVYLPALLIAPAMAALFPSTPPPTESPL